MRKLIPGQLLELKIALAALNGKAFPEEIFTCLQGWLQQNLELLLTEPFAPYALTRFSQLSMEDYPVAFSALRNQEFIEFSDKLQRYTSSQANDVARLLRDTLEQLVVWESDKQCSRCGHWGLGVYKDLEHGSIALECKQCGLATFQNGTALKTGKLVFANMRDLRDAQIIS